MDFQNRAGSKPGAGGVASASQAAIDRRERIRKLMQETYDVGKDPYFYKNPETGGFECRLCLTLHVNEGSYISHAQAKKHQTNLARRKRQETKEAKMGVAAPPSAATGSNVIAAASGPKRRRVLRIGRPGYKATKIRDPVTRQVGLLFQVHYPQIGTEVREGVPIKPLHRYMSAFEQKKEPVDRAYQYLIFAAEPYETISFKIQNRDIDHGPGRFWDHWDDQAKLYSLQFLYKSMAQRGGASQRQQ